MHCCVLRRYANKVSLNPVFPIIIAVHKLVKEDIRSKDTVQYLYQFFIIRTRNIKYSNLLTHKLY